jgi:hypothetical protein
LPLEIEFIFPQNYKKNILLRLWECNVLFIQVSRILVRSEYNKINCIYCNKDGPNISIYYHTFSKKMKEGLLGMIKRCEPQQVKEVLVQHGYTGGERVFLGPSSNSFTYLFHALRFRRYDTAKMMIDLGADAGAPCFWQGGEEGAPIHSATSWLVTDIVFGSPEDLFHMEHAPLNPGRLDMLLYCLHASTGWRVVWFFPGGQALRERKTMDIWVRKCRPLIGFEEAFVWILCDFA